jgi:hypothetical protein
MLLLTYVISSQELFDNLLFVVVNNHRLMRVLLWYQCSAEVVGLLPAGGFVE